MTETKNDTAWGLLFEKHRIPERIAADGYTVISSAEINEFREARLMTKFDHRSQLPKLFSDNGLSILPTSRGTYVIGAFETFCDFNTDEAETARIAFPSHIKSIDYRDITSEATAINCAFVTGILQDFTGEEHLCPTVSGRMSSSSFDFTIRAGERQFPVSVNNAQIEIDGGYEGAGSLCLIEAKNYLSDDFLIRQLYYPYRLWADRTAKRVRPLFLTYSNGIFHLREYEFTDAGAYNSILLVRHKKYSVGPRVVDSTAIRTMLDCVQPVEEPRLPFPQANSFERVINLCELLRQRGFLSKEEITLNYDFDQRQTDYYTNAGKYLGLIEDAREDGRRGCTLTTQGQRLFGLSLLDRQLEFARLILSHGAFAETTRLRLDKGSALTEREVVEIMKRSALHGIDSDNTYHRRASTVAAWTNWIVKLIED